MLDHERLRVYQLAIEVVARILKINAQLPKGYAKLTDQLWRSSTSTPANIAEGVGKRSFADRRVYYDHARGSAFETAAHLDIVRMLRCVADDEIDRAKADLEEVVRMLSVLVRREPPPAAGGAGAAG